MRWHPYSRKRYLQPGVTAKGFKYKNFYKSKRAPNRKWTKGQVLPRRGHPNDQ